MGLQGIVIGVSACVTLIATVAYMIFERRRYVTNNPNAIGDSFSVFRNERCPICRENAAESDLVILNCGHGMHQQCLVQLNNHRGYLSTNRCPICRTPIRLE